MSLAIVTPVAVVAALPMFRLNQTNLMRAGGIAPDFVLPSQTGESVRLYDLLERSHVVLYFYVQDYTPG